MGTHNGTDPQPIPKNSHFVKGMVPAVAEKLIGKVERWSGISLGWKDHKNMKVDVCGGDF